MENSRRGVPKFTCYFCNRTIENETQVGHSSVCGSTLVACPNKCGSYIPRRDLNKHNKDCVNRVAKSSPNLTMLKERQTFDPRNNPYGTVGRNGTSKSDIQDTIYKLSRKVEDLDSRFQFFKNQNQQYVPLQTFESLKTAHLQLNLDIEKLKYQNQITFEWRSNIDVLLSQLKQNISSVENYRRDVNVNLAGLQSRIGLMEKFQDQINQLKDSFLREQAYNRQVDMNFNENIDDFKKQLSQDNTQQLAILSDLKDSISSLKLDLEDVRSNQQDQGIKFTNIIYDLNNANHIATIANKKVESLEKDFEVMKKNVSQMKLDMEILEGLSASSDMRVAAGRLVWKITDIDTKMVEAKQNSSVLKSPIFYTHEYGYRVRIFLYLNGLNKWKDRYALLSLHVLKGEHDLLLKWPCQIEGSVTLRDLDNLETPKPFTKIITAKRQHGDEECEDPQESSSCYIFIPHTTLLKFNYMKNDTVFLDIKIRQTGKLETSL
ncbi:unnamed protein product [Psylliodes chrysocephalus]|uniref:MATH domain-containing protein n=1 Tax=Psylliodes chrysocephalus TaxID=3402493 RepID=A0A9P0CRL5_9CUCU|nr:unnamed protein product [Psylliodes chrysocephala]